MEMWLFFVLRMTAKGVSVKMEQFCELQSNLLNGSPDNGSIRLLVHVMANPSQYFLSKICRIMVQSSHWFNFWSVWRGTISRIWLYIRKVIWERKPKSIWASFALNALQRGKGSTVYHWAVGWSARKNSPRGWMVVCSVGCWAGGHWQSGFHLCGMVFRDPPWYLRIQLLAGFPET